jgi:septal ring factor EnvC (AmiA/AmiB activator)
MSITTTKEGPFDLAPTQLQQLCDQLLEIKKEHKAMKAEHRAVGDQLKVMSASLKEMKGLLALASPDFERKSYNED